MAYCSKPVKSKAGANVTLPLGSIHRDPLLRSRVGPLDGDHVSGMAESIREGHPPPRPTVFHIAGRGHFAEGYYLVGGFHTVAAFEAAGVTEISVVVKSGTWEEAVLAAASQNQEHDRQGLKRSNADKRHAVMMVLTACPEWSDRKIAAAVGVDHDMVGVRRRVLAEAAAANRPQVAESATSTICFRTGQDGKRYPLPVPDRARPSSREEHREPIVQSWEAFGGQTLPLLKSNVPLPKVYPANQLGLKQISFVIYKLLDHYFTGPLYCPRAKRMMTDAEKADEFDRIVRAVFDDLYDGSEASAAMAESLEALRDERFPAGALP